MRTIGTYVCAGALALGVGCSTRHVEVPDYRIEQDTLNQRMDDSWWESEAGQEIMEEARVAVGHVLGAEERQGSWAGETAGELLIMSLDEKAREYPELEHHEYDGGEMATGFVSPGRDYCVGFQAFHEAANEMYPRSKLRRSDAMQELFRRFIQEKGCEVELR